MTAVVFHIEALRELREAGEWYTKKGAPRGEAGRPLCVFTDWRQLPTMTDAVQAGGWVSRGIVVWDKTEACRPAMGRFAAQCEYVLWGTAGASNDDEDVGCLWGVIREPVRMADKHHVTGKPTAVMQRLSSDLPSRWRRARPVRRKRDNGGRGTDRGAALHRRGDCVRVSRGIARHRLEAAEANLDLPAHRASPRPLFPPILSDAPPARREPGGIP